MSESNEADLGQLGADHAQEQLESDHFRNWVLDELHNPPEDRITDPRQIARNMLQQLVWDTERQLRVEDVVGRSLTRAETKEFMDGFREAAKSRESLEWLTEIVSEEMDAGTMSEIAAKFRVGDAVTVSAPHGVERGKIVGPARRTGDVTLQIDFGGTVQPFRRDKEGNWRDPGGTQVQIAVASGGMNEAPRKGRTIKADDGSIVAHVHPKPYSGLERTQWIAVLTKTGAKSWDIGRYGARSAIKDFANAQGTTVRVEFEGREVSKVYPDSDRWAPTTRPLHESGGHGPSHLEKRRHGGYGQPDFVSTTYHGIPIATMTDAELRKYTQRAWDANEGDELRGLRAEAKRRGVRVAEMRESPDRGDDWLASERKRLLATWSRKDLISWLVWNDPNGIWTDKDMIANDMDPMTQEDAVEQVMEFVKDNRETPEEMKIGSSRMGEAPRRPRKSARFPYRHEDAIVTDPTLLPSALADRYEKDFRARGLQADVTDSQTTMPRNWDFGNTTELTVNGKSVTISIRFASNEVSGTAAVREAGTPWSSGNVVGMARASTAESVITQLVSDTADHLK